MSESILTLKIASQNGNLRVISKLDGDVAVKTILLKLILGYCWWANVPTFETILKLLEETIKNTLKEVYSYDDLIIDYDYRANDLLEDAPLIEVFINSVMVDGTEIEVTGRYISFECEDNRGFWKKLTAFRRKVQKNVHKEL